MDLGSRHGESDPARRVEALKPLLRKVLAALGEDPDRDGLRKTPERWAKALLEYTRGRSAGSPRSTSRSSSSSTRTITRWALTTW